MRKWLPCSANPLPRKHRQPPRLRLPWPGQPPRLLVLPPVHPRLQPRSSRGGESEHLRRHARSRNFQSGRVRGRGFDRTRRQRCQPVAPAFCLGRVRGLHDGVVHRFLPLLPAAHPVRAGHFIQDRLSRRLRFGRRHQVSAEVPHLGGPHSGPHFRDLRALHSPRLHSRLEAGREQVQMSLPRQRVRQRRRQLRRTGAASHGPGARSRLRPTVRFWWMFRSCTSGPRDSPASSMIRGRFCQPRKLSSFARPGQVEDTGPTRDHKRFTCLKRTETGRTGSRSACWNG